MFTIDSFLKPVSEIVVRKKTTGELDTTFSGDGRLAVPFVNRRGLPVEGVGVGQISETPEGNGKLWVLFTIEYKRPANRRVTEAELLKLNADGSTDTSFGENGSLQLKGAGDAPQLATGNLRDRQRRPSAVVRRFKSEAAASTRASAAVMAW